MSELNGRRVKSLRLHTVVHIPGVGQTKPVIDANDSGKLNSVKLTKVTDGVLYETQGTEVLIPYGNIVSIQFEKQ